MPVNPSAFELRGYQPAPPPPPWRRMLPAAVLALAVTAGILWAMHVRRGNPGAAPAQEAPAAPRDHGSPPRPAPRAYWPRFVYPTDSTNLLEAPIAECFQDTGAGNPQSGMFGTVRTGSNGLGQFHEGLDIRCLRRDRRGQPLDRVYAVADGRVAYANRVAGNSNYGKYVVLLHEDAVGEVYTLYAHLAEIGDRVRAAATVSAGETIGVMGNTSSGGIPMERAHLHFEIGVMVNSRFDQWYRARRQLPDHGLWHGYNLLGLNPLDAFRVAGGGGGMDFARLVAATPSACTVAVRASQLPDFFRRHPALWQGAPFDGPAFALTASENGAPLSGRNATPEEAARLGNLQAVVLDANAGALGRNGRRIVQAAGGGWKIGSNGQEWLEILLYPARLR